MSAYGHEASPNAQAHEGQENRARTGIGCTRHGGARMRQRGMKKGDADLILAYGTQVDAETWFLSNRDVHREIEARKREIQALERLRNRKVVVCGTNLVTTHPSRSVDQKRALRRARQQGLTA